MKFRVPALLCVAFSFFIAKHGSAQINFFNIANGDVAGLKNALTTSNSDNKDDVINLATNGTYTLSAVDNVTNGANGLPVIGADGNHSVTIHGHGSTITRSGSTPFRILQMAASSSVFIDNVTISNALIANFSPGDALGAAIYGNGDALTLTACTFTSNTVQGANGGDGISGEPNGNNGDDGEGGALYYSTGALSVTGCTFTSNSAVGGKGGNAFFSGGGNGGVGGTGNGGAIVTFGSPVTNASCTFTGNTASGGNGGNSSGGSAGTGASAAGGAIFGGFDTTVTKCIFSNNSATAGQSGTGNQFGNVPGQSYGGALALPGTIAESTLVNNTAQNGGALLVGPLFFGEAGTTTVTGCLVQNNSASIEGGAVHVTYLDSGPLGVSLGFLAMSNCTISGDIAPTAQRSLTPARLHSLTARSSGTTPRGAGPAVSKQIAPVST